MWKFQIVFPKNDLEIGGRAMSWVDTVFYVMTTNEPIQMQQLKRLHCEITNITRNISNK